MIICITGATGFIGQRLALKHLALGDSVRVFSRRSPAESGLPKSLEWHGGDLVRDDSLVSFVHGADVLYHCAGEIREPLKMESLHITGTHRLAEAASGVIRRWVQLSSVGVYGPVNSGCITERSKLNPIGPYEITKERSDQIIVDAANKGGFSYSILRPSNVYGPSMTNQSLFNMIAMIDRGLFFFIGKPGASANYIHVDNVVEALVNCGVLGSAKGKIFNLSDYCTLEQMVEMISMALGRNLPKVRVPEPVASIAAKALGWIPGFPLTQSRVDALVNLSIYPITSIQQDLDYQHVVSMKDGIRELVDVYKQLRLKRTLP